MAHINFGKYTNTLKSFIRMGGIIYGKCVSEYCCQKNSKQINILFDDGSFLGMIPGETIYIDFIDFIAKISIKNVNTHFSISYEHDKLTFNASSIQKDSKLLIPVLDSESDYTPEVIIEFFKNNHVIKSKGYFLKRINMKNIIIQDSHRTFISSKLDDDQICIICLDTLDQGWKSKCCESFFHDKCLIKTFEKFTSCPLCRKMI